MDRARRLRALREAGAVRLETTEGTVALRDGCLDDTNVPAPDDALGSDVGLALATQRLGERQAVAAWLERVDDVRISSTERPLAYPWPRAEPVERIELPATATDSIERPQHAGISGLE